MTSPPTLPAQGSTSWDPWAQYIDTHARAVLNVKDYGAAGNGIANDTAAIQAAIDAAYAAGGGVVQLPVGVFMVSNLTMKHLVNLHGVGKQSTIIKAIAGSAPAKGLINFAAGPVFAWLRDLEVRGNGNSGQVGIYAQAVGAGVANNGGWWYSGLSQVIVRFFVGADQIWLRGGGSDFLKPHQFLTFTNVEAYTTDSFCALRMTGQVGQVPLIQCEFDGPAQSNAGTNIFMGRTVNDSLTVIDTPAPYFITAHNVTCQSNQKGLVMESCTAVTWTGYFEAVSEGISTGASCSGIFVQGCTMGNVGAESGAGFCVKAGAGSQVVARDNVFGTAADTHLLSSSGTMWAKDNYVSGGGTAVRTSGVTGSGVTVDGTGTLNVFGVRTCLVNTSATQIKTITSVGIAVGETLSIKATGGSIVLGSGGNIDASGRTFPLTVVSGAVVTLIKYDAGTAWNIQSISA